MAANGPQRRELSSWKEISDYLGVSVRTAQKWESQRGLPVKRFAGEKGRVSADTAQLDRWRQSAHVKPDWWSSPGHLRLWALSASALVVALGALYLLPIRNGPPAWFRHQANLLIVTDAHGRDKARLLLARRCINRKFHEYYWPASVMFNRDRIKTRVREHEYDFRSAAVYYFDRGLSLISLEFADGLAALHRELEAAGQFDHRLTDCEINELRGPRLPKHWRC